MSLSILKMYNIILYMIIYNLLQYTDHIAFSFFDQPTYLEFVQLEQDFLQAGRRSSRQSNIHCIPKKGSHQTFGNNFVKS